MIKKYINQRILKLGLYKVVFAKKIKSRNN